MPADFTKVLICPKSDFGNLEAIAGSVIGNEFPQCFVRSSGLLCWKFDNCVYGSCDSNERRSMVDSQAVSLKKKKKKKCRGIGICLDFPF